MENQHRLISGYRDLTADEVEVINELKACGAQIEALLARIQSLPGVDQRTLANVGDVLQTGLMWAVRAVAKPSSF